MQAARGSRHASIGTRLARSMTVPGALAGLSMVTAGVADGAGPAMLGAAGLMLAAFGATAVVLHQHVREVLRPLAQARAAVEALSRGDYRHRVRVERLDEAGQVLVALDDLSNYLAVMLPEEEDTPPAPGPRPDPTFDHIVERLWEGDAPPDEPAASARPAPAQAARPASVDVGSEASTGQSRM
ncbi:MAG: hypothetical protein RL456_228 [Pseudomonadota bacterium]